MSLINQTVLLLSAVPQWVQENAGFKPSRSTVFRWKTRGCRGKRLKTFRVGGRVCTSVESLERFFNDDDSNDGSTLPATPSKAAEAANAFLESEGI